MRLGNSASRDRCRALRHPAVGPSTIVAGFPHAGFTDWRVAVVAIGRPRFFFSAAPVRSAAPRGRFPTHAAGRRNTLASAGGPALTVRRCHQNPEPRMAYWTSPKKEAIAATPRWPAHANAASDTLEFDSIGRRVGRTPCVNSPLEQRRLGVAGGAIGSW
jgi:hypothetical protein